MSDLLIEEEDSQTADGQLMTLPDGPSLNTGFDTFVLEATTNSTRLETSSATAYTFAVLETSNDTTIENKPVKAMECKIDFCVASVQAELVNNVYKETTLQHTSKNRLYSRKSADQDSPSVYLEFDKLEGSNATDNQQISLDKSQPPCLGAILNFDQREVVALTEVGLDGIEKVVEDISTSASRMLRTVCDGGIRHTGSSWETVTLVRITWWWLILPICVEVFGLGFFCMVGFMTTISEAAIWKSSLIAALYHGLDSKEVDGRQNVEGSYAMEQVAEQTKVTLSRGTATVRSRLIARRE